MSSFLNIGTGSGSIYIASTGTTNSVITPLGTEVSLQTTRAELLKSPEIREHGISPRLFFKLVQSKLTEIEQDKLRVQLLKLQRVVEKAKDLGQQALYEKLSEMIAIAVRELEVAAVGCDRYVEVSTVEKFRRVRQEKGKPVVYFEPWEKFPRLPPSEVAEKIKRLKDLGLFDEYWILYLDYTRREEKGLQTTKEKIREKDPILFGKFSYQPDRLYFITDWVDDYCDLTLRQFVDEVKETDLGYAPGTVDMTQQDFDRIKDEVMGRYERLKGTTSSNFRQRMAEEDEKNKPRRSWWARLLRRKGKK